MIYIPTGQTGKLQPLDVGINGPLKSCARRLWKEDRLSDPDKIQKMDDGVRHLSIAVNKIINENIITNSFKKRCH